MMLCVDLWQSLGLVTLKAAPISGGTSLSTYEIREVREENSGGGCNGPSASEAHGSSCPMFQASACRQTAQHRLKSQKFSHADKQQAVS
jgi:hypothetical protein